MNCRFCQTYIPSDITPQQCRYCPECGSSTARMELDITHLAHQTFVRGVDEPEIRVTLRNTGSTSAMVKSCWANCDLAELSSGVAVLGGPVEPESTRIFAMRLSKLPSTSSANFDFRFVSNDGKRGVFPDWNTDCQQEFSVKVTATFLDPGCIAVYPNAVFLRAKQDAACLTLHNIGSSDAELTHMSMPPEITVTDQSSAPLTTPVRIPAGEQRTVMVTTANINAVRDRSLTLEVRNSDPITLPILVPKKVRVDFLPTHVVGIDFGTANTSIAVRELLTDDVVLLKDKRENTRFPSAMYVKFSGPCYYGDDALTYWTLQSGVSEEERDGFLVEELKSELRVEGDPYVGKYGAKNSEHNLAVRYFSYLKRLIDDHFDSLTYRPREDQILYYVTLPVLDKGGEQFSLQKEETRLAVEAAGFPSDQIEFPTEPESAALYCFKRLREAGNFDSYAKTICVFDSGGGTTDICLMTVIYDAGGAPVYSVKGICGQDARGTTFGGHNVTTALVERLMQEAEFRAFWKKSQPEPSKRLNVSVAKVTLTSALSVALVSGTTRSEQLAEVSVSIADEASLSKRTEDAAVTPILKPVMVELGAMQQDLQQEITRVDYVLAVGGNSLIPVIREQLYEQFGGDKNAKGVLPGLTKKIDGKLPRTIIGDSEETAAIMEAVVNGSVLWYGAKLTRVLPFDLVLDTGTVCQTIAKRGEVFRAVPIQVNVDPNERMKCKLTAACLTASYDLSAFDLEESSGSRWQLDFLLADEMHLVVGAQKLGGGRSEICSLDLTAAIEVLS